MLQRPGESCLEPGRVERVRAVPQRGRTMQSPNRQGRNGARRNRNGTHVMPLVHMPHAQSHTSAAMSVGSTVRGGTTTPTCLSNE